MSWLTAPLRKVAPPKTAQVPFNAQQNVWQLSLDQIESETGEIVERRYAPASEAGPSSFCFDTGNILYSKLRPYLNKVAIPDQAGIATTELIPLRPNPTTLNPRFLAYYLRSPGFVNQASHHVAGAKMPRVVMDWFWEHEVPLPAPKEQSRIVELLDEADRLRRLRREGDAKAARILPALFLRMFGDPETNPMGWKPRSGAELFAVVRYGVGTPPPFTAKGIPFLRATNLKPQGINRKNLAFFDSVHAPSIARSKVRAGDVVIVRRGANTGDCVVITEEFDSAYVGYDLICEPSSLTNPIWFAAAWNYPTVWKRIDALRTRAAQQGLNRDQIESFQLPTPPRSLQDTFANMARAVRDSLSLQVAGGEKLDSLFNVLLHRAFSGQLTAKWREAHMEELLAEMAQQARALNLPLPKEQEALS